MIRVLSVILISRPINIIIVYYTRNTSVTYIWLLDFYFSFSLLDLTLDTEYPRWAYWSLISSVTFREQPEVERYQLAEVWRQEFRVLIARFITFTIPVCSFYSSLDFPLEPTLFSVATWYGTTIWIFIFWRGRLLVMVKIQICTGREQQRARIMQNQIRNNGETNNER